MAKAHGRTTAERWLNGTLGVACGCGGRDPPATAGGTPALRRRRYEGPATNARVYLSR